MDSKIDTAEQLNISEIKSKLSNLLNQLRILINRRIETANVNTKAWNMALSIHANLGIAINFLDKSDYRTFLIYFINDEHFATIHVEKINVKNIKIVFRGRKDEKNNAMKLIIELSKSMVDLLNYMTTHTNMLD